MKKAFLILFLFGMTAATAYSQLSTGSIGIGASFATEDTKANIHYCMSNNLELLIGLGYQSASISSDQAGYKAPDAQSIFSILGGVRFFLNKGKDVSPYVAGTLSYSSGPTTKDASYDLSKSDFQLAAVFGAQYNLAKNFGIYAHLGIMYDVASSTYKAPTGQSWPDYTAKVSTMVLGTSAIGAVFYFDL